MQARLLTDGRCLRVVDGDTLLCRIVCPCCRIESEQRIRLARINAPELKGEHAAAGRLAKTRLKFLCEGKQIKVCVKIAWPDRYGRVIAEVWCETENMSDTLLNEALAVPYGFPPLADWD